MTAVAVAEVTVDAPLDLTFARFIDFSRWDLFMPQRFRPLSGPSRALRERDELRVGLGPGGRVSTPLKVIRLRPNKEICWRAGVRGLLWAEHSFFFHADGDKTRIRSEEPFEGLFTTGLLGRRLEREATTLAELQLHGFATHLAASR